MVNYFKIKIRINIKKKLNYDHVIRLKNLMTQLWIILIFLEY